MHLSDIVDRVSNPRPWVEGEKIPWNDPDFSRRMLPEHLSHEHDAASRRFELIDGHVSWIHSQLLKARPTRVLDLGCGPGLYANRLARLGHHCTGIDFAPASIAYAREQAEEDGLAATYIQQDIRTADYGGGYGLVMLIFGEFNVFRPADARVILEKAYQALLPDGLLLLEPHTAEAVRRIGMQPPSWYSAQRGLFSARPHLCLQERFWDAQSNTAIERWYVIEPETGEVAHHSASTQAYTQEEYRSLLVESGFNEVILGVPPGWHTGGSATDLTLVLSRKK